MTNESRQRYRPVLEASLIGDFDTAERLSAGLGDMPVSEPAGLIGAAFYLAVRKRFQSDRTVEAVQGFVKEALAEFEDTEPPLRQLIAEGVVQTALGEAELMAGIDDEEVVRTQLPLAFKIIADSGMTSLDVTSLLDQAEVLAVEWDQAD